MEHAKIQPDLTEARRLMTQHAPRNDGAEQACFAPVSFAITDEAFLSLRLVDAQGTRLDLRLNPVVADMLAECLAFGRNLTTQRDT